MCLRGYFSEVKPDWLNCIRLILVITLFLSCMIGAMMTGICYGGDVTANAGFSEKPFECIIVGHRVEKNVCRRYTCYPGYILLDIPEVNVNNFELRVITNDFDSSIEKTELQLNQTYPLESKWQCYYGSSGVTFQLSNPLNGCSITGMSFLALGAASILGLLTAELVYLICFYNKNKT